MPQEHRTELANRAVVLSPILRAVEVPVGIVPGLWPCGCYSGPEVGFWSANGLLYRHEPKNAELTGPSILYSVLRESVLSHPVLRG
jgi:hypothetical protein